jgi:hypothetical protein
MSFTTQLIPMIAGAPKERWEKEFSQQVVYSSENKNLPTEGSFGVHFHVHEDLEKLYTRLNGNRKAIEEHLLATVRRNGEPISKDALKQVLSFLAFARGDHPLFFLRKGNTVLGLYQKTRSYYYDTDFTLCHRIGFKLVRLPNKEELDNFNLYGQTKTFIMKKCYTPVAYS